MSLATRLAEIVTAIGQDIKALYALAGGSSGATLTFRPWYRYKFTVADDTIAYTYTPGYINVYKDGHLLRPDEDYDDSSGTEIVFTETQPIGVEIDIQPYSMENLDAGNLRTRINLTATAGQTVFTDLSFPTGTADVYRNGLILPPGDYTENGTTLTLLDECDLGDNVTILSNKLIPSGSYLTTSSLTPISDKIGTLSALVKPPRTDLVAAINAANRIQMIPRTTNIQLTEAECGDYIRMTGSFTQSFDALSEKWWVTLHNVGTGDIGITTDGVTYYMYPGEMRCVYKTATRLDSFIMAPFEKIFTSSALFTKPPGYRAFGGMGWAAGAGAGKSGSASYDASGGGGGACKPIYLLASRVGTTENVVIGAGGVSTTTAGPGGVGGTTSIGTLWYVYGGGPGHGSSGTNITGAGGGGGGLSAGAQASNTQDGLGGKPYTYTFSIGFASGGPGFGGGGDGSTRSSRDAAWGGAAGGDQDGSGASAAGRAIYGGGGGGGSNNGPGGTSDFGGKGGKGNPSTSGEDGEAPGGGGGATRTGTRSGAGARGEIRLCGVM